jgi:hypothetical protein
MGFDIGSPCRAASYYVSAAPGRKRACLLATDANDWDMLGRASMHKSGLIPSAWMTGCGRLSHVRWLELLIVTHPYT